MSGVRTAEEVPVRYGIAAFVIFLATAAYAILIGQSFLWLWTVLAVATLGPFMFVLYLFYRLVVAVERIAYGP